MLEQWHSNFFSVNLSAYINQSVKNRKVKE